MELSDDKKPTLMSGVFEVWLRQRDLSAKDEPSNPFKNPRKAPSDKPNTAQFGRKGGIGRGHAGAAVPALKYVN